jgi:asparagine synthase (glutamine-hydrolysing)
MCGIWQLFLNTSNLSHETIKSLEKLFNNVKPRGPDKSNFIIKDTTIIGFHRLAINGLNSNGMQPFTLENEEFEYTLICNGEIYNYIELEKLINYQSNSNSDCEVLLPFLSSYCGNNIKQFLGMINGEFSMVITIKNKQLNSTTIYLTTDPLSVRPMFYQEVSNYNGLLVSSLLKGMLKNNKSYRLLQGEVRKYIQTDQSVEFINSEIYHNYIDANLYQNKENYELYKLIVDTFTKAVERRLISDRPFCCLLSGGLDSSLVAAVAQRLLKQKNYRNTISTFTIGMKGGSDIEYAKQVSDFISSNHTEVYFTPNDGLSAIDDVIEACETYDITTIRASVGQNLLAKYISSNTDFKVILNGDGADEVEMGYLYFYLAPSLDDAQKESEKLVKNICMFDGLRVDRNVSHYGLEARVPFLDKEFVNMYMNIDPKLKIPTADRMEKYLIRKAFDVIYKDDPILPKEVLWRKKEAFSDGVSQKEKSWYIMTQEYGKSRISDDKLLFLQEIHKDHIPPTSHESAYYRDKFNNLFGKGAELTIPYFWLPNWSNNTDPSARTLEIYSE